MRMENEFERRMRGIDNPTDKQFQDALQAVFGLDMNAARINSYQPIPDSGFDKSQDATSRHGYGSFRMDMPASGPYYPMFNSLLPPPQ